jgi:chromosome segregation ATPase
MRYLILLLALGCANQQVKDIESKFNDRKDVIEAIEKKTASVKNTPETVQLKEQVGRALKELRSINQDLKACSIENVNYQSKLDEANKRLEDAEFALGFLAAFRWALIGLGLVILLYALVKFKVINLPF